MSYANLELLKQNFKDLGCKEVIVKLLAQNQDNEKNQIYMGYSNELLSLFPGKVSFRTPSESRSKSGSVAGKAIVEHRFEFYWIENGKAPALAPKAKIIDYFQYPEMRFSGFLSGCANSPDALRRDSQDGYGRRVLVLGFADDRVYGTVLTDKTSTLVNQVLMAPSWPNHEMFKRLSLPEKDERSIDPGALLGGKCSHCPGSARDALRLAHAAHRELAGILNYSLGIAGLNGPCTLINL